MRLASPPLQREGSARRRRADIEACAIAQRAMGTRSVSLAGRLSLGELGALIADTRVLVCNNGAPSQLAAAVGTPVVVLYALTNPQHTPWRVPSRVLNREVPCRDCLRSVCPLGHHACLLGVPPEEVADAALELWRDAELRGDTRRAMRMA